MEWVHAACQYNLLTGYQVGGALISVSIADKAIDRDWCEGSLTISDSAACKFQMAPMVLTEAKTNVPQSQTKRRGRRRLSAQRPEGRGSLKWSSLSKCCVLLRLRDFTIQWMSAGNGRFSSPYIQFWVHLGHHVQWPHWRWSRRNSDVPPFSKVFSGEALTSIFVCKDQESSITPAWLIFPLEGCKSDFYWMRHKRLIHKNIICMERVEPVHQDRWVQATFDSKDVTRRIRHDEYIIPDVEGEEDHSGYYIRVLTLIWVQWEEPKD